MEKDKEIVGKLRYENGRLVENTLPENNWQTELILESNRLAGLETNRFVSAEITYVYTDPPEAIKRVFERFLEIQQRVEDINREIKSRMNPNNG